MARTSSASRNLQERLFNSLLFFLLFETFVVHQDFFFFKKYIFRTSHIKLLDFIRVEIKYVGRSVRPKWSHTVESTIVQSFIFLSKTVSFRLSYVILLLINIFFSGTFYLLFGDYTLFKCKTICFFLGYEPNFTSPKIRVQV